MLRRRPPSILAVRAFCQVSSSPLFFHSSHSMSIRQNPLGSDSAGPRDLRQSPARVYDEGQNANGFSAKGLDFGKRSDFDRAGRLNSSGFYGGNSNLKGFYGGNGDGQQERNNFGGIDRWNSNGFNAESPNGPQRNSIREIGLLNSNGFDVQNPNGHQRSNLGEIHRPNSSNYGSHFEGVDRWNSNRFNAEYPNGPQRNNIGEIRQLNSNGLNVQNPNSYQRSNFAEIHQSNLNNFGGAQQLNPHGYFKEDGEIEANGHYQILNTENQRNSSEFYQNPSQDASRNWGGPNEFTMGNPYQKSTGLIQRPNYHGNLGEFPQNSNASYGYDTTGNGELRGFQQNSNGNFRVGQGNPNQDFYGHNSESPLPAGQQNPSQFFLAVSDKVDNELTGDGLTYKGTLTELDECCQKGEVKEAVEVLDLLRKNGVAVDLPRYLALLQVCGEIKSLDEARIIHDHICQAMGDVGVVTNNKILDMYAKCGSMVDAYQLFEKMPQRNLTSWDTMINGLANNNLGEDAIDIFTQFKELGLQPDGDLFIAVFNACGVLRAVDEGMLHFQSMEVDFGISPTMKHYVGIVEMLGRNGYLDEALEFIEKMPVEPSIDVWESLMNLCRVNGYQELGNRSAEIVEQLDCSRLTEQTKMGLLPVKGSDMKERKNNSNSLEFKRRTHELRAGDRSHPESDRIYEQLQNLLPNMKEVGYTPNTRLVLHDIDPEARAEALMAHSEKLAAAYFLFTSPPRSPMRILKNLRFCTDCHEAMKIISKLTGRLIISRDAKRFHHFENGVCSCKDFY